MDKYKALIPSNKLQSGRKSQIVNAKLGGNIVRMIWGNTDRELCRNTANWLTSYHALLVSVPVVDFSLPGWAILQLLDSNFGKPMLNAFL